MLKESILFVASTGLLIYFMAPADKPQEAKPVQAVVQEPVKPAVDSSDDGWGYDEDEGDVGEAFTFGEPMTLLDDGSADDPGDEDPPAKRQEQSDGGRSATSGSARAPSGSSPNSVRSGEPGSLENPIVFKTNNPANPVDD